MPADFTPDIHEVLLGELSLRIIFTNNSRTQSFPSDSGVASLLGPLSLPVLGVPPAGRCLLLVSCMCSLLFGDLGAAEADPPTY
jgi:hypothetical protein